MTLNPGWNEPILKQTQAKRQHFVPQMYLQSFARADGKIRVIDLQEGRMYATSLKNVAVETGFYNLDLKSRIHSAEDWLARLEGEASIILSLLKHDPSAITSLCEEQEDTLAKYIAAQFFRTQVRRQDVRSIVARVSDDLNQKAETIMRNLLGKDVDSDALAKWLASRIHGPPNEEVEADTVSTSIELLGETQGFGNLLRASPWRIGNVSGPHFLYSSDNPVVRYLAPIRSMYDFDGFWAYDYYFPLSQDILFKIERRPNYGVSTEANDEWGHRRRKDFSQWEVSMARHIISRDASRFLYGEGPMVSRQCAASCLDRIEWSMREFASRFLGYNPSAPPM